MYSVKFHTSTSFELGNEPVAHRVLDTLLECLVQVNMALMSSRPFPDLYSTRVRYRQEPLGEENWRDAAIILQSGYGDCEDLAAFRVAELRVKHRIPARCVFRWKTFTLTNQSGKHRVKLYHILVGLQQGKTMLLEDPSKRLGMPSTAPEQSMGIAGHV
jgi:Transglutaminase-like superfamily